MAFNWGNLINKRVKIYLSKIADEHLERILDKDFSNRQHFDDCVEWYRILISYLNQLAALHGVISIYGGGLLQMSLGDLGYLTFQLFIDINGSLSAMINDFEFNPYKTITEKKVDINRIIIEVIDNYLQKIHKLK
jgi:hypothetical protein